MKRLLSVLIGFLAAGVVAYVKSGDIGSALVVGLAFTVPIAIAAVVLPGWNTITPAVIFVAVMAIFGPAGRPDGLLGAWLGLWIVLTAAAVIAAVWYAVTSRRSRKE